MTDVVSVRGIRAWGRHGALAEEQVLGQPFLVDVELGADLAPAGRSDDLSLTVNYAQVAEVVVRIVTGEPVALIETVAERIAAELLALGGVEWVQVEVHKPQAPIPVAFDDVSVRIRRPGT